MLPTSKKASIPQDAIATMWKNMIGRDSSILRPELATEHSCQSGARAAIENHTCAQLKTESPSLPWTCRRPTQLHIDWGPATDMAKQGTLVSSSPACSIDDLLHIGALSIKPFFGLFLRMQPALLAHGIFLALEIDGTLFYARV